MYCSDSFYLASIKRVFLVQHDPKIVARLFDTKRFPRLRFCGSPPYFSKRIRVIMRKVPTVETTMIMDHMTRSEFLSWSIEIVKLPGSKWHPVITGCITGCISDPFLPKHVKLFMFQRYLFD